MERPSYFERFMLNIYPYFIMFLVTVASYFNVLDLAVNGVNDSTESDAERKRFLAFIEYIDSTDFFFFINGTLTEFYDQKELDKAYLDHVCGHQFNIIIVFLSICFDSKIPIAIGLITNVFTFQSYYMATNVGQTALLFVLMAILTAFDRKINPQEVHEF